MGLILPVKNLATLELYFMEHTIKAIPQGTSENIPVPLTHILAVVDWYENHPQRDYFGESVIVTSSVSYHTTKASFIPVSRIGARCAYVKMHYTFSYGEDCIVVCVPSIK